MKLSFSSLTRDRRRGLALIIVISAISLIAMLVVAIFSVTRSEFKATQGYVAGKSAKQYADMATAVVISQIQSGHNTTTGTGRTIHATQPGMVRVYNSNGTFNRALKLFSAATMQVQGGNEAALLSATHIPPQNWATQKARYVDINEPVVRPALQPSAGSQFALYFPVIDPRAAWNENGAQSAGTNGQPGTTQIEGFSYETSTPASAGGATISYDSVIPPASASNANALRLPMPVEWLYILQDGTIGALNASNDFVPSATGSQPSSTNPIVGRIAFWTDDESCKVNINTASEPTVMGSPFYYHERDQGWAHFPGVSKEYQRYPGHPATVALSTVLAPYQRLDVLEPSGSQAANALGGRSLSRTQIIQIKEDIYNLVAPKIGGGGSKSGTKPFGRDDFSAQKGEDSVADYIDLANAASERLYASVDELLFQDSAWTDGSGRRPMELTSGSNITFFNDNNGIERSRFFLTAHSRSPEFSMLGVPRICMWPVADESLGQDMRTSFDNAIALCASLRGKSSSSVSTSTEKTYFFRRKTALHSTADVNIGRNSSLLDYLSQIISSASFPATAASGSSTTTFGSKYGSQNANQLAIQFFDYIRCTNLYDGVLARTNNTVGVPGADSTGSWAPRYVYRDNATKSRAYTTQRIAPRATANVTDTASQTSNDALTQQTGVLPGHGQVTPALWAKSGTTYRGMGRMFTLSEIGLQFICTADGANDSNAVNWNGVISGGGTAQRYEPQENGGGGNLQMGALYPYTRGTPLANQPAVWFSNYPPLSADPPLLYGVRNDDTDLHPSKHPGYDPMNWNLSLPVNTPLTADQKRVQALILLETFCPSLGWTKFYPEFTITLDGDYVRGITLNGQKLFDTTGEVPVKSNGNIFEFNGVHPVGGHATPSAIASNRRTRPISGTNGVSLPSDLNYETDNVAGHNALMNYAFVSDFITVPRNGDMQLAFPGGDLQIKIYDTHNWQNSQPIQIINVNLGGASNVPVPHLIGSNNPTPGVNGVGGPGAPYYYTRTDTWGRIRYRRTLQGPHWWSANFAGILGRMTGRINPGWGLQAGEGPWLVAPVFTRQDGQQDALSLSMRGRLDTNSSTGFTLPPNSTADLFGIIPDDQSDVIRTMVPAVGDYRIIAGMYNVPSTMWKRHPAWESGGSTVRQAHSFTGYWGDVEPGARLASDPTNATNNPPLNLALQLAGGVRDDITQTGATTTDKSRLPDLPGSSVWAAAANSFGDFDAGVGNARNGPYINKPDEGNFYIGPDLRGNQTRNYRSGYFYDSWDQSEDWRSGIYMTPNRQVSSPAMFGSLPTGVWPDQTSFPSGGSSVTNGQYTPWRTLLFRPHAVISNVAPASQTQHPGAANPADHYLLDLFFMPVVEPYAISEPLSVAGRINMNYQIYPFTNIRRATGMHAVLKSEYVTAIPNNDMRIAKGFDAAGGGSTNWSEQFWKDSGGKTWHRPIDIRATLRQFDLRFAHTAGGNAASMGLFRSPSQICEMHLVPRGSSGSAFQNNTSLASATNISSFTTTMNTFWGNNRGTGDNVRERPYANIYPRLTTRSNTFRVHVRAQVIRKARSVAANTFDPQKDTVLSEYRGSSLIERYIDPNDSSSMPDYAAASDPLSQTPLDVFYRFRTLETKRFNP